MQQNVAFRATRIATAVKSPARANKGTFWVPLSCLRSGPFAQCRHDMFGQHRANAGDFGDRFHAGLP